MVTGRRRRSSLTFWIEREHLMSSDPPSETSEPPVNPPRGQEPDGGVWGRGMARVLLRFPPEEWEALLDHLEHEGKRDGDLAVLREVREFRRHGWSLLPFLGKKTSPE